MYVKDYAVLIAQCVLLVRGLLHVQQTSGEVLHKDAAGNDYEMNTREHTRPDVFLLNNAAVYTSWYQVCARV